MPEQRLNINFQRMENGKIIDRKTLYYDGPRFQYADYPVYTPAFEIYGEWAILIGLCDTILYHRPYCVVELGAGESTPILARAAQQANVPFHSVDVKVSKRRVYGGKYQYHQKMIQDFMKGFTDTPAIVLIDANHDYEIARKEFEFFFDKLVEGGVIFLHDTYPPHEQLLDSTSCHDVYRLRQDIEKMDRDKLDVLTWPYTAKWMGLTMVIKKEKERPFWGK